MGLDSGVVLGGLGQPALAIKGHVNGHQKDSLMMSGRDFPVSSFVQSLSTNKRQNGKLQNKMCALFGVLGIAILEKALAEFGHVFWKDRGGESF